MSHEPFETFSILLYPGTIFNIIQYGYQKKNLKLQSSSVTAIIKSRDLNFTHQNLKGGITGHNELAQKRQDKGNTKIHLNEITQ